MEKAVFLDRDGTIIADGGYMFEESQIEVFDGVRDALSALKENGWGVFILSNQSGVYRKYFTIEQAEAFQKMVEEKIGFPENFFDGVCLATDYPASDSGYRKPSPRYLLECAEKFGLNLSKCWMAGDRISDWQCGINAGATPAALPTGEEFDEKTLAYIRENKVAVFKSFAEFANALLKG